MLNGSAEGEKRKQRLDTGCVFLQRTAQTVQSSVGGSRCSSRRIRPNAADELGHVSLSCRWDPEVSPKLCHCNFQGKL